MARVAARQLGSQVLRHINVASTREVQSTVWCRSQVALCSSTDFDWSLCALLSAGLAGALTIPHAHCDTQQEAASQAGREDVPAVSPAAEEGQEEPPVMNDGTAQWRLFTDVGRDLVRQGRPDEAEKYLVKALAAAKTGFGEQDPHVAAAANNLAELLRIRKQYAEAAPLYEQAVRVLEASYGSTDVRLAAALHNMGGFYVAQREYAAAQSYYERALKVKHTVLGPRHPDAANTLFHLAEVIRAQGKSEAAIVLLQEWWTIIDESGLGLAAGSTRKLARLTGLLLEEGRPGEAEPLLRRMLAATEEEYGIGSLEWAQAAAALAACLQASGNLAEALQLLQRSLNVRTAKLGLKHPGVGVAFRRLAEVELAGKTELAADTALYWANKAVEIAQTARMNAARSAVKAAYGGWWFSRFFSGKKPAIQPLYQDLRTALEFSKSLRTLSSVHQRMGRSEDAREALQRGLSVLNAVGAGKQGSESPTLSSSSTQETPPESQSSDGEAEGASAGADGQQNGGDHVLRDLLRSEHRLCTNALADLLSGSPNAPDPVKIPVASG